MAGPSGGRITAILGPTNTGKTHYAMERMAAHSSGIMGFPLRLLARENYDKFVAQKGASAVALVTGEEKIIPAHARYWICTVESMPLDRTAEFLAVDEIQLAADPERGHIFTDRLLNARGLSETLFLGAETIRPVMKALLPDCRFETRPRLSTLSYVAPKKISRIPARSALVVFSAQQVYRMAESIRQHRGGTAVVLGALSPRTRNAQVEMYQSGEVDYLVATDAIGMGLNMDIDHVTFGALRKFDGRQARPLTAQELGQIAGRAGRHMNDGTFTTSTELGGLDEETVEAIEHHRYNPLEVLHWRNGRLSFHSLQHLTRSLDQGPPHPALIRAREADDARTLRGLAQDAEIQRRATAPAAIRLLWEVCQIPDFRKTFTDSHSTMLQQIYCDLLDQGRIDTDRAAKQIDRLDDTAGDIDTLVNRIAAVRTWTYISHHGGWMNDGKNWQGRTRGIEDRLSDALHDLLTNQFVDRRAATLMRRLKSGEKLLAGVQPDGEVIVEGIQVGWLKGLTFRPVDTEIANDAKQVLTAARKALADEITTRVAQLLADNDGAFRLDEDGAVLWRENPVARLHPTDDDFAPRLKLDVGDLVAVPSGEEIEARLKAWLKAHVDNGLKPLFGLRDLEGTSNVRAIAFQLWEARGVLNRYSLRETIRALSEDDRNRLRGAGVRFGRRYVWLAPLGNPRCQRLLAILGRVSEAGELVPATRLQAEVRVGPRGEAFVDVMKIEAALARIWQQERRPAPQPAAGAPVAGPVAAAAEAEPSAETADQPDAAPETPVAETGAEVTPDAAPETAAAEDATVPADDSAHAAAPDAQPETAAAEATPPAEDSPKAPDTLESLTADLTPIFDGDEKLAHAMLYLPEARKKTDAFQQELRNRHGGGGGDNRGARPDNRGDNRGSKGGQRRGNAPKGKGPRNDRAPGKGPQGNRSGKPAAARKEPAKMDPNSPFAALAGLKDQLKK